ncbi:hypothetical protein V5799_018504 [Amblyomma americanum]|uniref:SWIM-type domain-containing protein n=1 Tax=Amblyomma americanum TaxID=6943 RepID=A0AAQ4EZW5_AMBAM
MSDIVYPVRLWESDLTKLPPLRRAHIDAYVSRLTATTKCQRKAYKLVTESYVVTSSVLANYSCATDNMVFVKANCHRSQRKTKPPYAVSVALSLQGDVLGGQCECAAGKYVCNHLQAVLRIVALLQEKGFSEAPAHMSSTDLPQRWRVPRTNPLRGTSVQKIDWRKVAEGGQAVPRSSKVYSGHAASEPLEQQEDCIKAFADALNTSSGMQHFASVLQAADCSEVVETRYGKRIKGCLLSYQQSLVPHGFSVLMSDNLRSRQPQLWETAEPFVCFSGLTPWQVPYPVDGATAAVLKGIVVTPAEAQQLERASRKQRNSTAWFHAHSHRLTASHFGVVMSRKKWTEKGLANLTAMKDLSRVRAIRYGIANESDAILRYKDTMIAAGHPVEIINCGIFVNPTKPWLGASPDAIAFDPCEPFPLGYRGSELPLFSEGCYKRRPSVSRLFRRV